MLTGLCAHNFKSWKDTGQVRVAPLTGLFGTNSSGKSAILQMLLLLKQTVESNDQSRVLNTGDANTYVDVGTLYDVVNKKHIPNKISFSITWELDDYQDFEVYGKKTINDKDTYFTLYTKNVSFETKLLIQRSKVALDTFYYRLFNSESDSYHKVGISRNNQENLQLYELYSEDFSQEFVYADDLTDAVRARFQSSDYVPIKCYGFPSYLDLAMDGVGFLSELPLALETVFRNTYYLGPLRDYPHRIYTWSGQRPQDVGRRGEFAADALLAESEVTEKVAHWLKEFKLVYDFSVKPLAKGRREHEVLIQSYEGGPQVPITDVGFGVSQLLPVLTLCYYVPEGATILFEQPEIHLHPSVQAGLADVFIDVMKNRNVQIILESHSEHLLQRLQRRIAEEQISNDQTALYFCHKNEKGESQMTTLEVDEYGNINNWPPNFFGDEFGDVVARTEAAIKRQREKLAKTKSEQ